MWSNLLSSGEAAKERFATALKETNDSLSQLASAHAQKVKGGSTSTSPTTNANPSPTEEKVSPNATRLTPTATVTNEGNGNKFFFPSFGEGIANPGQQKEILDSFKAGWGNVVEATKTAVETTREVVEKEQTRIQASLFSSGPYVRGKFAL